MSALTMAIYCLRRVFALYARWILAEPGAGGEAINGQECGMWTHLKGRICRDPGFYQQFIYSWPLLPREERRDKTEFYIRSWQENLSHLHRWWQNRRLNITNQVWFLYMKVRWIDLILTSLVWKDFREKLRRGPAGRPWWLVMGWWKVGWGHSLPGIMDSGIIPELDQSFELFWSLTDFLR